MSLDITRLQQIATSEAWTNGWQRIKTQRDHELTLLEGNRPTKSADGLKLPARLEA